MRKCGVDKETVFWTSIQQGKCASKQACETVLKGIDLIAYCRKWKCLAWYERISIVWPLSTYSAFTLVILFLVHLALAGLNYGSSWAWHTLSCCQNFVSFPAPQVGLIIPSSVLCILLVPLSICIIDTCLCVCLCS